MGVVVDHEVWFKKEVPTAMQNMNKCFLDLTFGHKVLSNFSQAQGGIDPTDWQKYVSGSHPLHVCYRCVSAHQQSLSFSREQSQPEFLSSRAGRN